MWLIFGLGAAVCALLNVVQAEQNKNAEWFRFISLSLTALTVCAFYYDGSLRVIHEDWGGLMDIMPIMGKALWVCTGASILINSVSLFKGKMVQSGL